MIVARRVVLAIFGVAAWIMRNFHAKFRAKFCVNSAQFSHKRRKFIGVYNDKTGYKFIIN